MKLVPTPKELQAKLDAGDAFADVEQTLWNNWKEVVIRRQKTKPHRLLALFPSVPWWHDAQERYGAYCACLPIYADSTYTPVEYWQQLGHSRKAEATELAEVLEHLRHRDHPIDTKVYIQGPRRYHDRRRVLARALWGKDDPGNDAEELKGKPYTRVIIRTWKDNDGGSFALFPTKPSDSQGYDCDSYDPQGGHAGANIQACMKHSRPATPEETGAMLRQLRAIGYRPLVCKRESPQMRQYRQYKATGVWPGATQSVAETASAAEWYTPPEPAALPTPTKPKLYLPNPRALTLV